MGQRLIFGYVMSLFLSDFDLIFAVFVFLLFLSAQYTSWSKALTQQRVFQKKPFQNCILGSSILYFPPWGQCQKPELPGDGCESCWLC